jgi:cell division protein FtsW
VAWSWTRRALWTVPQAAWLPGLLAVAAAGGLALLAASGPARRHAPAQSLPASAGTLLAACGLILLWLQRAGTPAGAGIALLLAWAALWLALCTPRRLPLLLAAGVLLLGVGLLAQLELGLGAPESSWLRHFQKSAALLALAAGACISLGALAPLRARLPLRQARIEALLMLLAGLALLALLLQVAFGDETGVFDLQPVEFAKLALAAPAASRPPAARVHGCAPCAWPRRPCCSWCC